MRHPLPLPPLEARLPVAWPAPLAAAVKTPGLGPELLRRRDALRPRVAAYYTRLQTLPRRVRRALHRQWGLPLATLALWLALGQLPVLAATIDVGGPCTLVDAITAANTDTAAGGCPAGRGADTIVLPPGSTQTLRRVHNDTYGPTGLPVIRSVITIAGQGSTLARASGAPEFRLLAVNGMGALTLQETTVSGGVVSTVRSDYRANGGGVANYGGTLTLRQSTISGNATVLYCDYDCYGGNGGGVANIGGTLFVQDSTLSGNVAEGERSGGGEGGAVFNLNGTLTVQHSTISGNVARHRSYGGGVANDGGTVTVTHSTIAGNAADGSGGGVSNSGALTVLNSTIAGNAASSAGGLMNNGGTLSILNSTITGNSAYNGGGVANYGTSTRGSLTVLNSTIAGNAARFGGGVANYGTLTITNSTITGNSALIGAGVVNSGYTLTLARTLVAGNTAPTGPEVYNAYLPSGTVVADDHNLFGVDGTAGVEGFTPGPTDVVPPPGVRLPDILEPTLALHGGRTPTHALVPGSPAIDAAGPVCRDADGDPLTTDQRGQPRPVDGDGDGTPACDIGAFEFFPLVNDFVVLDHALDTTSDPTPVPGGPAGTFTITATFTHTRDTPLRFPFFEVTALSGGNLLLNADENPGGVGATLTPEVGDGVLAPGETVSVDFVIGLQAPAPFTFVVELFGEPRPERDPSPSRVQGPRPR